MARNTLKVNLHIPPLHRIEIGREHTHVCIARTKEHKDHVVITQDIIGVVKVKNATIAGNFLRGEFDRKSAGRHLANMTPPPSMRHPHENKDLLYLHWCPCAQKTNNDHPKRSSSPHHLGSFANHCF